MKLYTITDYDKRYKPTNKSGGELKNAGYVKLPVKPKGDGLEKLLSNDKGLEVFGIWCLLLEKTTAQKPETRGQILNFKDEPASLSEISMSISLKGKEDLVQYALNLLVSMGWIEETEVAEQSSEEFRKSPPKISKEKVREVNNNKYSPNSDEFLLASLMFSCIRSRKPDFKEPNMQVWSKHIDHMIRLDNRQPDQIQAVITWCQNDPFWQNNILSTDKLRKQFDKLELQKNAIGSKNNRTSPVRNTGGEFVR